MHQLVLYLLKILIQTSKSNMEHRSRFSAHCKCLVNFRKQRRDFLNRYNFAYAGRGTANTAINQFNSVTSLLI